jgi:YkoY family integral membrane protein
LTTIDPVFGQTFELHDLIVVAVLVVLEGVLSIDNALVLGLLARRLPKPFQRRALTYGLVGAFAFRIVAVATASYLLHWRLVKLLGGGYLIWVAVKHFAFGEEKNPDEKIAVDDKGRPILLDENTGDPVTEERLGEALHVSVHGRPEPSDARDVDDTPLHGPHMRLFWGTVLAIELTDIAFAVDSIVAAIGVVGPPPPGQRHPKLWVVIVGGMLGVILMRFAAVLFIKLLERFPRFETSAYLLVTVIGVKLVTDYAFNTPAAPDRLNLHSPTSPAFWIFWGLMVLSFLFGFLPSRRISPAPASPEGPRPDEAAAAPPPSEHTVS